MSGNVTIMDIAREAGVSIKTVSRVLNNQSGVASRTRERIQTLINIHSFRPNSAARALSGQQSYEICLLFPSMVNHYYTSALQIGAQKACTQSGYHLGIESLDDILSHDPDIDLGAFLRRRYRGVLLPPVIGDNPEILKTIEAAGLPFIRLAPTLDLNRSARVYIRDEQAAYDMMALLWSNGHRRIAFIVSKGYPATYRRLKGYQRFFDDQGHTPAPEWVIEIPNYTASFDAAGRILALPSKPTAIFASTDLIAAYVVAAVAKNGLSIPADISVAGFDDSPLADIVWPPLTTIHQPSEKMAFFAIRGLIDAITNASAAPSSCLEYKIVERQSVGKAPGA